MPPGLLVEIPQPVVTCTHRTGETEIEHIRDRLFPEVVVYGVLPMSAPLFLLISVLSLKQQPEGLGGQGVTEMKALTLVALLSPQKRKLLGRFHPLGNDPLLEV